MSVLWSLRRGNGEERSFASWGIGSAIGTFINQGRDTIELGFKLSDLLGNLPFNPDETLVVLRDGVSYFRGRVIGEQRGAYGSSEGCTLILAGPWCYLEKITYQQPIKVVAEALSNPVPADPDIGLQLSDFELVTKNSSDVIVSQDQTGTLVDSRDQILDALNYAIGKGAPIGIGTIDPGLGMPADELRDVVCAEVIQKCLRWQPDRIAWWDYSVNPPELNIRGRTHRPLQSIDIAEGTTAQVTLNPRRDLLIPGVTINYLRRHQRTNFEFITIDKEQAGPSPEGIGALIVTLELYGSYMNGANVIAQEPAPVGLAGVLYWAYAKVLYEGRIQLVDADIDNIIWLSKTCRVLNGNPAWASTIIDVQQVKQDLFAGRTELTMGPPRQLGPSDLLALVRKGRTKAPPLPDVLVRDGGYPTPPDPHFPLPDSPDPRLRFEPAKKPEPPHTDHIPADYASPRNGYSGAYSRDAGSFNCGGAGHPACPTPNDTHAVSYGGAPAYTTVIVAESSFGASLTMGKQMFFSTNCPPGYTFSCAKIASASGNYSEWTFDLTSVASDDNVVGVALIGTKTLSNADGSSTTTEDRIDLVIGTVQTVRASAAVGAEYYAAGSGYWSKAGSVTYPILRMYYAS